MGMVSSPLGRGFLTGKVKKEDLPEGDFRRNLAKFQDEVGFSSFSRAA